MHRYRARIDFVPLLALLLAVFAVDTTAIGVAAPAFGPVSAWLPFGVFLVAATLPCLLGLFLVPLRYGLAGGVLQVRSGLLLRWQIPVADIHRVVPARNLYPAPALSTQRLRVDYQHGQRVAHLYIAPLHREALLRHLTALDRGLHLEGGAAIRHGGGILLFDSVAS